MRSSINPLQPNRLRPRRATTAILLAMLMSLCTTAAFAQDVVDLKADGTAVQWAHTIAQAGSGIQYDLKQPIAFRAPEGMTIVLMNPTNSRIYDTGLNEVSDVHGYLLKQPDGSMGVGGLFYMDSKRRPWDHGNHKFTAMAVKKPSGTISLNANGTEVQWAHTIGEADSGMRYDIKQPIAFKAPAGMTVVLLNRSYGSSEMPSHDTGLNEVKDVHKYLESLKNMKNPRGWGGIRYMHSNGAVWDHQTHTYMAKAAK